MCYGNVTGHSEINLTLVFEYVEQDLATYLERCPSPGLGPDRIRVSVDQSRREGVEVDHAEINLTLVFRVCRARFGDLSGALSVTWVRTR